MNLEEATIKALEGKLIEAEEDVTPLEGQYSFDDLEKGTFIYETTFNLECPVNDEEAAQEYLSEDNMVTYLWSDDRYNITKDIVTSVDWILEDEDSGIIRVFAKRELNLQELEELSKWISGQNSDGLGEGFEQQDFAESYYNPVTGDGPYSRAEAELKIEDLYDDLDINEVIEAGYLDNELWEAVEVYKDENNTYDEEDETELSDDEIYDIIVADPESYLDEGDIDEAKAKYADDDNVFDIDAWFCMSSFDWQSNPYTLHRID